MIHLSKPFIILYLMTVISLLIVPTTYGSAEGSSTKVTVDGDVETYTTQNYRSSPKGTWTPKDIFKFSNAQDFIYGNNEYVTIGEHGMYAVSASGRDWNSYSPIGDYYLASIVWTGTQYVMWGSPKNNAYINSEAFFSTDGKTWKKYKTNMQYAITNVIYAYDKFFGFNNYGTAYVSDDGMQWKLLNNNPKWKDNVDAIKLVNGMLIVLSTRNNFIATSKDGVTWEEKSQATPISDVIWDGNKYVGIGSASVFTSSNALNWTKVYTAKTGEFYSIAYDGKAYVAVGILRTALTNLQPGQDVEKREPLVLTSSDFKAWKSTSMPGDQVVGKIIHTKDGFVGVSSHNPSFQKQTYYYFSKDGKTWEVNLLGTPFGFNSSATNGKRTVYVGAAGAVVYTDDGITFKRVAILNSDSPPYLAKVVWDGKKFVASGNGGVYVSIDGTKWKTIHMGWKEDWKSLSFLTWNGKNFLAAGVSEGIFTSKDGYKWTELGKQRNFNMRDLIWDGKKYIAIKADSGKPIQILYGYDGLHWKSARILTTEKLYNFQIAKNSNGFIGNVYRGPSKPSLIFVSTDGITWKETKATTNP